MKEGWELKKLGEVVDTINGLWTGKKEPYIFVKVYTMSNFTRDCEINYSKAPREVQASVSQYEKRKLKKGDLLLEKSGGGPNQPVGRVIHFDIENNENNTFSNFTTRLRVNEESKELVCSDYIHKFLKLVYITGGTNIFQKNSTNIRNLQLKEYLELKIPLPPHPEQQRIVAILDKAFTAIDKAKANAEQNLLNAKELFESYLQTTFDNGKLKVENGEWVESRLSSLCDIKHGFAFKSQYFTNKGEYVLLTPGNFYESGGYRDRGEKQKYYIGEIPDGYVLKKGDLLVAMTEQAAGLLGSPILVPESNNFLHNQRLGLIIPKEGVTWSNEFFFHVFNTHEIRKVLHDTGTGIKVRHTSPTKIGNLLVSYPLSKEEQSKIVKEILNLSTEIKKLEAIYRQKITDLNELKKSILQKAFSGEL